MGVGAAINGGSSSSSSSSAPMTASGKNVPRRRWFSFVPIFVALVVVAEIGFLGRLDMSKNAAVVHSWTSSFYFPSLSSSVQLSSPLEPRGGNDFAPAEKGCIDWLEQHDAIPHSRDFTKDPILVAGSDEDWSSCSVGCKFGRVSGKQPDAAFGLPHQTGTASVLRSMESSHYYAENNVVQARRRGYNVVMTTSLSSDVPVGYFSWAEYDIMAPVPPKTEEALAAAFISNCGARNFRLQALEKLEDLKITIDSYGSCHRNHDGRVDKVETLKRYKFSLAFENSNEEDYVTEKFFQSLVAGAVPVVVGAPNIQDFAPCPGSVLHIKELNDVSTVAKAMRHLSANPDAYNQSLRWKYEGPSDSFKALVDMAAVHSSCRLCIHLATKIYENDEKSPEIQNRPCECTSKEGTLIYHLFVRERGRFKFESIFLRSVNLTISALENAVMKLFKSLDHVPVWKQDRPASIRGGSELKIYRVYPFSLTQREALYSFRFHSDDDFRQHIKDHPCAKFEVIFV